MTDGTSGVISCFGSLGGAEPGRKMHGQGWRLARLLSFGFVLMAATVAGGREVRKMEGVMISSSLFARNGVIPVKYTCDGKNVSPPLRFEGVPAGARSLALIMDDPDAPAGTWDHWVVWNIAPATREIGEGSVPPGGIEGKNSWGRPGYGGPCPPSGVHRYVFRLYALDTLLNIPSSSTKRDLERAMHGHILGMGELVGLYKRH